MLYVSGVLIVGLALSVFWWYYVVKGYASYQPDNLVAAIFGPIFKLFGGWFVIGAGVVFALAAKVVGS